MGISCRDAKNTGVIFILNSGTNSSHELRQKLKMKSRVFHTNYYDWGSQIDVLKKY